MIYLGVGEGYLFNVVFCFFREVVVRVYRVGILDLFLNNFLRDWKTGY